MKKSFIKVGSLLVLSATLIFAPIAKVNAAETYKLSATTKVFMNANNAKSQVSSVGNYASGTYYVYKKYNGMINISKQAGVPGAWINPNIKTVATTNKTATVNKTTTTSSQVSNSTQSSNTYVLKTSVKGYMNADNAKSGSSAVTTLGAGTYYVYKSYNGMLNLTTKKGSPGAWVNPNANTSTTNTVSTKSVSTTKTETATKKTVQNSSSTLSYSLRDLQYHGVIRWQGKKFTYYSQSVLPGYGLNIPGRHVNSNGYVADKDGYIVLASNYKVAKGTVVDTPFGNKGKVYDRCSGCSLEWFDVYTK